MRFLSVNHMRLGARTSGVPRDVHIPTASISMRSVLNTIVNRAIINRVHAVLFSGETFSRDNDGLEAQGAMKEALLHLEQAGIPVVGVAEGAFNKETISRMGASVTFVDGVLEWAPPIVTDQSGVPGAAIRILPAALAETVVQGDTALVSPESLQEPGSVWVLTAPLQPDLFPASDMLIIEPGSPAPLTDHETGRHGVWLVDTESAEANLLPMAPLEFESIAVDISTASTTNDVERLIVEELAATAKAAREGMSVADVLIVDVTLTGRSRLYHELGDYSAELQSSLQLEHADMTIVPSRIRNGARPDLDLAPLIDRPDPVGELARLITTIEQDQEPTSSQQELLHMATNRILAVKHARVFGSIHDDGPEMDVDRILLDQSWAMLDSLVRQRGLES